MFYTQILLLNECDLLTEVYRNYILYTCQGILSY